MATFGNLREQVQEIADNLRLAEANGRLELDRQRMLLLSGPAFCELRAELIVTLGEDLARGLLKRCGFHAGFRDGHLLVQRHPELSRERQMHLGTILHQMEGWARVETLAETVVDLDKGILELVARWHQSIEAEQHVERLGYSDQPVCWMMSGYASGHLSFLFQKSAIVVETNCAASGRPHCDFRGGFRDVMEERFPGCGEDYKELEISRMFENLRGKISEQSNQIRRLKRNHTKPKEEDPHFGHMICESAAMGRAIELAKAVARVDSTVLITGESGTGKELLAQGIHRASSRTDRAFHAINCATLTESLQNAELFGYARGSFTGANRDKPGIFEATDKGTLFLDEVGELSPSAQASLLRVIQEGQVVRIGENRVRNVDVRIIAATHRNLDQMIQTGGFRQDLFFRLNVLNIRIPPLRERENDILLLASHLAEVYAARFDKPVSDFSPAVKHLMLRYPWPGNVRELQNAVERAVLLSTTPTIELEDLPDCLLSQTTHLGEVQRSPSVSEPESGDGDRAQILEVLRETGYNRIEAARRLGMSRTTLWRKMKRFDL